MSNIWGIFFSVIFLLLISIILVHIEGVEEGKRIEKSKIRRIK